MSPYDFAKVVSSTDLERATHVVFDEVYERWITEGVQGLTEGQITVYCVETVFGEVCNGGIEQYLDNESGQLAEHAPGSLVRVGLNEYSTILQEALDRCESLYMPDMSDDDDPRNPWLSWQPKDAESLEPFEDLTARFFEIYFADKTEFRRKLFDYIKQNEGEFVDNW